jgi:very-short-patch-repair endonuclease
VAHERKNVRLAQEFRHHAVPAESLLWKALRNRALGGFKFRRQHPVGPYIADMACVECQLIVEADGESHLASEEADARRSQFMEAAGWRVLRFWNTQMYDELDAVKEVIHAEYVRRAGVKRSKKVNKRGNMLKSEGAAGHSPPCGESGSDGREGNP